MKIAYVTNYDARDVSNWSGLGYYIWKSLDWVGVEVELIGPMTLPAGVQKWLKLKRQIHDRLSGHWHLEHHYVATSKAYGRLAWQELQRRSGIDAVVCPGIVPLAYLPGSLPVVTVADSTHMSLFDTYPVFKELGQATRRHADRVQSAALQRAAASVFSSEWAANSAICDYHAAPERVHVVPFGANFEQLPDEGKVMQAVDARGFEEVRLALIGVDWERKGGETALGVLRELIGRGIPAHLTIWGCEPTIPVEDANHVTVRGFVEKSPAGQQEILDELGASHFLIVPSVAECYGLVYCEASAMGVPSVARNVGGVGTIIRNEINGRLFELHETPGEIADWIASVFRQPDRYRAMALSCIAEYQARLNWTVAGRKLEAILRDVISHAS